MAAPTVPPGGGAPGGGGGVRIDNDGGGDTTAADATAAAAPVTADVPPPDASSVVDGDALDGAAVAATATAAAAAVAAGAPVKAAPAERLRPIERFFRGPWFRLVYRARFVSVAAGVALFAIGAWQTVQLEPLAEPESFLPPGHVLGAGFEWLNSRFTASADARTQSLVSVVYGITDVDRDGTSRYAPADVGRPEFDAAFDMTSAAAQASVLSMCDTLADDAALVLPGGAGEASCWVREFRAFGGGTFVDYASAAALGDAVSAFLAANPAVADARVVGVDGASGELRWFTLQFYSVTKPFDPPAVQASSRAAWTAAVSRVAAAAPAGVDRPYAVNGAWAFAVAQDALVVGAVRGAGASLAVGLLVLVASTRHLYVSLLAILCVGGVVLDVLGLAHALGWRLGVSESVAATIVVGFSLDYTIHLGNAFVESAGGGGGGGGGGTRRQRQAEGGLANGGVPKHGNPAGRPW